MVLYAALYGEELFYSVSLRSTWIPLAVFVFALAVYRALGRAWEEAEKENGIRSPVSAVFWLSVVYFSIAGLLYFVVDRFLDALG